MLLVINKLVDDGNSVLIIEHNIDILKTADHIIDIGPNGGKEGGQIICKGNPEKLVKKKLNKSHTVEYLSHEFKTKNV